MTTGASTFGPGAATVPAGRVAHLDGLRGVAILLVVGYHVYARWAELMPFGARLAEVPLFKAGWLGVELFFLISGFVILMTLERCTSAREFLARRWLRLFPGMLICSTLIFFSAPWLPERPAGVPGPLSLLPGLSFIDPSWWTVAGLEIAPLEWSFWSLYVEFKFYVFAALVYFATSARALVAALAAAHAGYIGAWALRLAWPDAPGIGLLMQVMDLSGFYYFGWFASGAAFYLSTRSDDRRWLVIALAVGAFSALFVREGRLGPALVAMLVPAFFAAALLSDRLQRVLRSRALLFVGAASYPLYLAHENFLVAATLKLHRAGLPLPDVLLPLPPLAALLILTWAIARWAEPALRRAIVAGLSRARSRPPGSAGRGTANPPS